MRQPAMLTLTVSHSDTSPAEYRIQIPMEKMVVSCSDSETDTKTSSSHISDTGLTLLLQKINDISLRDVHQEALGGGYGDDPVAVACNLVRALVVKAVEEVANGDD